MDTEGMHSDTEAGSRRAESRAGSPYLNRPLRTLAEAERDFREAESVIIRLALAVTLKPVK
jgi:hypothetical protein